MPALKENMTGVADHSLKLFMAELLQDLLRRDSDDNSKLPSNAGTIPTPPTSYTEGMGGFESPKKTQSRWGDSSAHKDAFLTPTSRSSRWDSSPKVAKKASNARDGMIQLRTTYFTEGMGGFASPKKAQSRWGDSSVHKDASLSPISRSDSSPKVPKKDSLITPPQRLPEPNGSIRIHRQKFRTGGGSIIQPLYGIVSCGDDNFTSRNLKTSSLDIETDAECNPHGRGRLVLPSSLQRLPYEFSPKSHTVLGAECESSVKSGQTLSHVDIFFPQL